MSRCLVAVLVWLGACLSFGQSWISSYASGLQDARLGHWQSAREAFRQAAANRPDDVSRPTLLPGSPTEPRKWRDGAPYSPNFLAAYCEYREAVDATDPGEQTRLLKASAGEFETLLAKGQQSRDVYFFLDLIYTRLGDQAKRQDLSGRLSRSVNQLTWKVDEEVVAPEELAAMGVGPGGSGQSPQVSAGSYTTGSPGQLMNPIVPGIGIGAVPAIPEKFALVLAEGSNRVPGGQVAFAAQDAETVRNALVNYAGYSPANVVGLVNGTAHQVMDAARKLAASVPQDGVVTVFFVGTGLNVDGRDYLATSDTMGAADTGAMVSKNDLYNLFLTRGGRIFAFYETSRPIANGGFFGSEPPAAGAVSQMQATVPDASITSIYYNGHPVGLYAQSFADVLAELRSNRIPIYEFVWQIFNKMRRGNTGTSSGASRQIPTLPVLNNLAADARF